MGDLLVDLMVLKKAAKMACYLAAHWDATKVEHWDNHSVAHLA